MASPSLPSISIVTPSLNQARYLEGALRSIHGQEYQQLEHVVMDGGSSDGSADVLARWRDKLAYSESEPDHGQYDALQRGFAHTTGEIMGWLNADDLHTPWTLSLVADLFTRFPEVSWLTTLYPITWDEAGRAVQTGYGGAFSAERFRRGRNLPGRGWFAGGFIQQESTFWRRSLWERAGSRLDLSLRLAGDFELWARFFEHEPLWGVAAPLAGFRRHGDQKTAYHMEAYRAEAETVLRRGGFRPPGRLDDFFRRWLTRAVGGRPLVRMPGRVGRALTRAGFVQPAPVCYWHWHEGWKLRTDYVI
jgi:Glycosyl transferase family 2